MQWTFFSINYIATDDSERKKGKKVMVKKPHPNVHRLSAIGMRVHEFFPLLSPLADEFFPSSHLTAVN